MQGGDETGVAGEVRRPVVELIADINVLLRTTGYVCRRCYRSGCVGLEPGVLWGEPPCVDIGPPTKAEKRAATKLSALGK